MHTHTHTHTYTHTHTHTHTHTQSSGGRGLATQRRRLRARGGRRQHLGRRLVRLVELLLHAHDALEVFDCLHPQLQRRVLENKINNKQINK